MLKIKNRKLVFAVSGALLAIPVVAALAASTSVNVTATFRHAISLTSGTNLDFSKVDYSNNTVTASDYVTVGTDGSSGYNGNWTAGTGAATTAGDVQVLTGDALAVWVECSNTATLKNGTNTIQATGIEVSTTATTFGGGNACQGIGTHAFGFTLAGGGADHIKVGGKLDGGTASGGTIASGAYSTSGGTPVQVDVYYQ